MNLGVAANFAYRFLAARMFGQHRPLLVGFSLTERCVFRCRYCFFSANASCDLSFSDITKIIDRLCQAGLLVIQFTGGEPCLREDLSDIITYARKKNLLIMLSTSGYDIQKHEQVLMSIDSVQLSLDGPASIHDAIRGKGSFDIVMRAADFLKSKHKRFNFRSVLTSLNIEYISDIIDIARQYKTTAVFQPFWMKDGSDKKVKELMPQKEVFIPAIEKLIRLKKEKAPVQNAFFALEAFKKNAVRYQQCAAGKIFFRVEANGDIFPCCRCNVRGSNRKKINLLAVSHEELKTVFVDLYKISRGISCSQCLDSSLVELNAFYNINPDAIRGMFEFWKSMH